MGHQMTGEYSLESLGKKKKTHDYMVYVRIYSRSHHSLACKTTFAAPLNLHYVVELAVRQWLATSPARCFFPQEEGEVLGFTINCGIALD